MYTTTPTDASANPLSKTAAAYLDDLGIAARRARYHRDAAKLDLGCHWLTVRSAHGLAEPYGPMNVPSFVMDARRDELLHVAATTTQDDFVFVTYWYARAAMAALQAVLAGETLHGRDLEKRSLAGPDDEVRRPALPEVGVLDTGHDHLDRAVRAAQVPLEAAYSAAADAEHWDAEEACRDSDDDEPGLADWEAGAAATAVQDSAALPDLLIKWAEAVHQAAAYGRSRSLGHVEATD